MPVYSVCVGTGVSPVQAERKLGSSSLPMRIRKIPFRYRNE